MVMRFGGHPNIPLGLETLPLERFDLDLSLLWRCKSGIMAICRISSFCPVVLLIHDHGKGIGTAVLPLPKVLAFILVLDCGIGFKCLELDSLKQKKQNNTFPELVKFIIFY